MVEVALLEGTFDGSDLIRGDLWWKWPYKRGPLVEVAL